MSKLTKLSGSLIVLVLASLACNLGAPRTPEPTVAVSTEAVESLIEAWQQAFETGKETGQVNLTMTELQLTSFLALGLAEKASLPFSNPQVILRAGEMEITGTYTSDLVKANVSIIMEVTVDAGGLPRIEVTSGKVGPLPVPADLLTAISDSINEALTGQVGSVTTGFTLETITISDDALSLTGSLD
jgi:hypothetical protein